MNEKNLIYAKAVIDGRCIDLLLEQEDLLRGFQNALDNPTDIPAAGQCWINQKADKCGIWDRIMNRCCGCNDG